MKVSKYLILILTITIFSCKKDNSSTVDCLPSNLQNGIIGFYPFNNGNLDDESGNGNNLNNTTTATSSTDRDGNANCAYVFDNLPQDGEFLSTANTLFLNGHADFSISLWYYPMDSLRPGGKYESLLSRGDDSRCPDRSGEWAVGLYDGRRAVFGHDNSVWVSDIPEIEKWYHVVAVKNDDNYKIYWNGNLYEEETGDADCLSLEKAQDIGAMFIGNTFTGKIDDIVIYNRSLSGNEVAELFDLDSCCG